MQTSSHFRFHRLQKCLMILGLFVYFLCPVVQTHNETAEEEVEDVIDSAESQPGEEEEIVKPVDHLGEEEESGISPEHSDSEGEDGARRHRHFPICRCKQKLRSSYITADECGKTALCYWEIMHYNSMKAKARGTNTTKKCDTYRVQKYACLIGYPKPRKPNKHCGTGLIKCQKALAKMLYRECQPLRKFYGYPKPEDVQHKIDAASLNYKLIQDQSTIFRAQPTSEHPKWNNYYTISCPMIYRHPYFTIDLLLKDLDPTIEYSEVSALTGVAEMLPQYVRAAMNDERILNFDALSIDESYIHWCGIPRNYVCVRQELDVNWKICDPGNLEKTRTSCLDDEGDPRPNRTNTPLPGATVIKHTR